MKLDRIAQKWKCKSCGCFLTPLSVLLISKSVSNVIFSCLACKHQDGLPLLDGTGRAREIIDNSYGVKHQINKENSRKLGPTPEDIEATKKLIAHVEVRVEELRQFWVKNPYKKNEWMYLSLKRYLAQLKGEPVDGSDEL